MNVTVVCNCGNKEILEVSSNCLDYFEEFTLWSNYDDNKVFLECDKCGEKIQITVI